MKNNPTKILKIPVGLKKQANELGIWSDVVFYYKLKSFNIEGNFPKKDLVYNLAVQMKLNRNVVYRKLARLKKLGWVFQTVSNKNNRFLSLLSYDKVWSNINTLSEQDNGLKLIKIASNSDFDIEVNYNEIKISLNNQKKVVERRAKNLIYKKLGYSKKTTARGLGELIEIQENIDNIILDNIQEQHKSIRESKKSKLVQNWEVTLTCNSIAKLLGYSSAMSGWLIASDLSDLGYINYISRFSSPLFITKCSLNKFKGMNLDSSFFYKNNGVYKILPNLIQI